MPARLAVAMAFVVLLVACGEADDPATAPGSGGAVDPTPALSPTVPADPSETPSASELAGTEWILVSLDGEPIGSDVTITLSFTEDQVSGNAGCNDYGGSYTANADGEFSTTDIFNTEMGCMEPPNILEIESAYLELFRNATTYRISGGQLEVGSVENEKALVYTLAGEPGATASPTITSLPDEPVASTPQANMPSSEAPAPFVDMSQLDNPDIGVMVYWLGEQFAPGGELPAIALTSVYGPPEPGGGPADMRGELQYADEPFGSDVKLRLMRRADWDTWMARDPVIDDHARILHMFWESPCAEQEEIELDGGRAVIYSSYQLLADPALTECPDGPFDRFLAHVFIGDTVVLVNAPHFLEPPDMPGFAGPYNSVEGLRAVVSGLQPREPVAEPTPVATPAATLDDPRTLVLQPADLPGRYGYGDDGCSPAYECNIGPGYFSSEGGYDELQKAAGEFLSVYMQYEHTGFTSDGTPDPTLEPPRIDGFVLICLDGCDPAAILDVSEQLLRYYGHSEATELDSVPDLEESARLYETNTLVVGQVVTGHAVVWRDGPVVGLVAVGGVPGEQGAALARDLSARQAERIQIARTE